MKAHQSKPQHGQTQLSDETKFKVVNALFGTALYLCYTTVPRRPCTVCWWWGFELGNFRNLLISQSINQSEFFDVAKIAIASTKSAVALLVLSDDDVRKWLLKQECLQPPPKGCNRWWWLDMDRQRVPDRCIVSRNFRNVKSVLSLHSTDLRRQS